MRIEIKHKYSNSILFSYECENNTILRTLLECIKQDANLSDANLSRANLSGANLRGADLRDADLRGANLRDADLRDADLRGANLRDANLSRANLSRANLSGANLSDADLSGANLPIYCKWDVSTINQETIKIGCKEKSISEWVEWFENSDEVFQTNRDTDNFKKIRATFYAHKTYLEILNNKSIDSSRNV